MSQRRAKTSDASNSGSFAGKTNSEPGVVLAAEGSVELYTSPDGAVSLPVRVEGETVWATQAQMADLFGVDSDSVGVHLRNAFEEIELDREATTEDFSVVGSQGAFDLAGHFPFSD